MSFWRLAILSLTYHWRINLAVAFGVAAATAVLTGALLVGDSVKGSLRHLTLERLGEIDEVLVTDRFFREALADELTASEDFIKYYDQAAPAILFPSTTIELKHAEQTGRSTNVLIVGCNASFWEMGDEARPTTLPGDDEIVLNQALADDLNATVSSEVVARLPKGNQVPADSPLANKSDRIRSLPGLKVVDVIPARGLGRFSLRPSQSTPLVAFVSIATLQDVLDQDGKINSLLVSLKPNISPTSDEAQTASKSLASAFHPSFEDYGLAI
ncbi:MAG TPA: ABC transporter permease, partial [Pirellulaceae bacterium]|nr:ABC transporter permease [Pirellulaceae bacterium]